MWKCFGKHKETSVEYKYPKSGGNATKHGVTQKFNCIWYMR